jgi:hypothetical protein
MIKYLNNIILCYSRTIIAVICCGSDQNFLPMRVSELRPMGRYYEGCPESSYTSSFFIVYNTYVVKILSAKIYISSEHIYQKLLNCDLHLYLNSNYIQHIYLIKEHFDNVNGVQLTSCLPAIYFFPISAAMVHV